ncbi:MAG: hypothetical protein ORO03_10020 [Alphaproteobacteria bacterium]|nr:hypothetical protein [Alphaproteobacteria bacterium]
MKAIARELGLPETATEAEITTAVAKLRASTTAATTPPEAKAGDAETVKLRAELATEKAKLNELAVDHDIAAGRIMPATKTAMVKLRAADPAEYESFVKTQNAAAGLTTPSGTSATPPAGTTGATGTAALRAEDHRVIETMGLKPDEFATAKLRAKNVVVDGRDDNFNRMED